MKPIEPGCLALHTGGTYVSGPLRGEFALVREVVVIEAVELVYPRKCGCATGWIITESRSPIGTVRCCGHRLIRIDGDPDEIKEREEMTA